jgi:acyl-CoA hydrolase
MADETAGLFESPLTDAEAATAHGLAQRLQRGCRVVFADGAGAPFGLLRPLAHAARAVGGVELVLGWYLGPQVAFPADAFPVVRGFMGGYGLEGNAQVRFAPVRLSAMPALVAGPWAPHLLLVGLCPGPSGLNFGTEVAWLPAAMRAAAHVVAELNHGLPAVGGLAPHTDTVTIVAEVERAPATLRVPRRSTAADAIGGTVASLIEPGASLQFGPGVIADAALRALEVPVRIDSGVISDPVLDLVRRGLILGDPVCAYVAGSAELYAWAEGGAVAKEVEFTHDLSRLSRLPLVAINTAIEIDRTGQVNVERAAGRTIAGIGGHADFAVAATRAVNGLSIVALPTSRGGRPTLVDTLGAPVSTGRSDVDVVVTELGYCDLRGRSDDERRQLLDELW